MALLALPLAFLVLGLIVGRWWPAMAAVAVWCGIAVFLVLNDGWFGHGWGDGGILLNVIVAALTVAAAAVGAGLRAIAQKVAAK